MNTVAEANWMEFDPEANPAGGITWDECASRAPERNKQIRWTLLDCRNKKPWEWGRFMSTVLLPSLLSSRQERQEEISWISVHQFPFMFMFAICPCVQLTLTALFSRASYTLPKQILDSFNDSLPSSQRRLLQPSQLIANIWGVIPTLPPDRVTNPFPYIISFFHLSVHSR